MDRITQCIFALLIGLGLGCDKPPPPPPSVTEEDVDAADTQPAAEDRRPSLADVMGGRWQSLPLGIHPLRVQAPEKWEVKRAGSATFLRGPTPGGPPPDGEINIMVSKPAFPKEVANSLVEESRRRAESAAASTTTPALEQTTVREVGPVRIVDQRQVMPPRGGLPEMMRWTLLVFVPVDDKTVNSYQLSFMDLTTEHYQKDKPLLEKILSSLAVDASAMIAPVPDRRSPANPVR